MKSDDIILKYLFLTSMKTITYTKKNEQIVHRKTLNLERVEKSVRVILDDVKKEGDNALVRYTKKFDGYDLKPKEFRITRKEIKDAYACIGGKLAKALKNAHKNIKKFHTEQYRQIRKSWSTNVAKGVTIRERVTPIDSVGCYVPGGLASYPSTVLMTCVPAKVAGVEKVIIVSPPPIADPILVAADISGVKEIYRIGGAQSIGALAFGTETIPSVSKIVGPGNKYVLAAKNLVYGSVDIDMPAGPSEIMILADRTANPRFIASDILAQAEHDPDVVCILVTISREIVKEVSKEIKVQIKASDRKEMVRKSLKNSIAVVTKNVNEAVKFANNFAPEHLEVMTRNPEKVSEKVINAGSIFLGDYSPVAAGDYATGANHVLPTGGGAKFASPLSVRDFLKVTNIQKINKQGLKSLKETIETVSEIEGLNAHSESVGVRFE